MPIEFSQVIKMGEGTVALNVADPSSSGFTASEGAVGKGTDDTLWLKTGAGDTDWTQLIDKITGNALYYTQAAADAAFEPAGVSASDITDGTATGQAAITAADDSALRDAAGATSGVFPVAALPTQTTITDTDSSIPSSGAVVDYVTASANLKSAYSLSGIYSSASESAVNIDTDTDIGLLDITIAGAVFVLADWTPSADVILARQVSGNNGWILSVTNGGLLRLQLGNGTNFTTYQYDSTVAMSVDDMAGAWVGLSLDRDGDVNFLVNGTVLGAPVDISGSVDQFVYTSSADIELLPAAAGWVFGEFVFSFGAEGNATLSELYLNPDSARSWGTSTYYEVNDFSTDNGVYGAMNGGTDSYGQTIGGLSDAIKLAVNSSTGSKYINTADANHLAVGDHVVMLAYQYYVPSTNSDVTGLQVIETAKSGTNLSLASPATQDAWTTARGSDTITVSTTSRLRFYLLDSGSQTVSDAGGDDVVYLRGITYAIRGVALAVDLAKSGTQKSDSTSNNNHGFKPLAAEDTVPQNAFYIRGSLEFTSASSAAQSIGGGGREIVPDGAYIDQILIRGATGSEHWTIGDESDADRYVAEFSDTTSLASQTIANATSDGVNREITIAPTDGAAGAEARNDTIYYSIRIINSI